MKLEDINSMEPGAIFPLLYEELKAPEISLIFDKYKWFCRNNPKKATQDLRAFVIYYYKNRPVLHDEINQYIRESIDNLNIQQNFSLTQQ